MSTENENVQIYPARIRIVPNSKLVKNVCNLSGAAYDRAINGTERKIVETRNHKKFGKVKTPYKLSNNGDNTEPLDEFDRAVLSVCVSEMEAGNRYTTPSIIFRGLTGKIGRGDAEPSANQRAAIMTSLLKLMGTLIWIDDEDTNEKLKYESTDVSRKWRNILYAKIDEKTINGQDATVVYFICESPLWTIADARNQVIRYDASLLDVPHQQNTRMNITIKNYVMNRVMEIKLHKQLAPTLTFADIFEKTRITNASRKTKMDARNAVKTFFDHLQAKGVITTFTIIKKGASDHAVTFTY